MAQYRGNMILRHPVGERVTHWAVAIVFIFLFTSGLALFHPFYFWISSLYGSGQMMRFLHPIAGVGLVLLFYPYAARVWRDNRWIWLGHFHRGRRRGRSGLSHGEFRLNGSWRWRLRDLTRSWLRGNRVRND